MDKIEEFLNKFRNEEAGEDSYKCYCYENVSYDNDETVEVELDFHEELDKVMKELGFTYECTNCGGFDSPGYSIDCYCISYIDPKHGLQTIPVAFESY